jgi:hypothetical protein
MHQVIPGDHIGNINPGSGPNINMECFYPSAELIEYYYLYISPHFFGIRLVVT